MRASALLEMAIQYLLKLKVDSNIYQFECLYLYQGFQISKPWFIQIYLNVYIYTKTLKFKIECEGS